VPAGTMISIGWVGSHALAGADDSMSTPPRQAAALKLRTLLVANMKFLP
jgi:hypothetical protein